ncbi:Nn.00g030130.m01.CDS01 [Neocucurbitaria sp. VM-36]
MALEEDQIVGFDKYPVSHRGMAYGARPAPSGSGTKPSASAELRNTILDTP